MKNLIIYMLLATTALTARGNMVNKRPVIIAHRGASWDAPENTLASIELAWERGADIVEIDIYLTLDEEIVAMHDASTKRTGGRNMLIKEQTLEQLKLLDVGSHKGDQWKGERIPTLKEILATVPEGKKLFIEIKTGPEILEKMKMDIEQSELKTEQIVFICFDYSTIAATKKQFPKHKSYWLRGCSKICNQKEWEKASEEFIEKAKEAGLDGLNLQACNFIDADFVCQVQENDLELYVWTVNNAQMGRKMLEAGVEGITTDRPLWLKEQIFQ